MHRHHGKVVVVQTGTAQVRIIKVEAQRLHQVQLSAGNRRQANRVAGIAGNFRGIEKNLEHVPKCTAQPPSAPRAAPRSPAEPPNSPSGVALADPATDEHA